MVHHVTLEEAASHLPELVLEAHNGQDVVLFQDERPVAKLVSLSDDVTSMDLAALAMSGDSFDWLADEPELYTDESAGTDESAARVPALLRQWQQEFGLPTRPDGKGHTSAEELFAEWDADDAQRTPEEAEAEQRLWEEYQSDRQGVTL